MSDVLKYKQSQGTASLRRVYFTAVSNADVTVYLQATDLSTWTVKLSKNGGTPATPSGAAFTEVSSTDQKGVWYLTLNAVDLDTLGRAQLVITNAGGSTPMRRRTINFLVGLEDGSDTATANLTQLLGTAVPTPTTAGYLRTDVHAMEAGVLTATAIASSAFSLSKFAADMLLSGYGILDSGTCQAGSSTTTLKLRAGASASNGSYANGVAVLVSGTGALQTAPIASYVGSTKIATLSTTWAGSTPDGTTGYVIYGFSSTAGSGPSAATIAAAVWATALVGSAQAGDLMRLSLAIEAGPVSDFTTGTLVFKCPITGKTRATGTTDATGRLTVVMGDLT